MNKFCRFCGKKSWVILYGANKETAVKHAFEFSCTNCGFGSHGVIIKCQGCGIIYVDEKISQEKVSTYYEVAEDPLYFKEQKAREMTFKGYLRSLEKFFPKKGKLLDIGTNTGLFVKVAKDHGWDAVGLEPNIWGAKYAKENYHLNLINKSFKKGVFPKNSFEVVTMWDVIEHFTDPVEKIDLVFDYLKPGGMFAFSTIDPESLLAKTMGTKWSWYMEMHKVFFTRPVVKHYLEKTGFSKIYFKPHFRRLSLGYLSSRLLAVNPILASDSGKIVEALGLAKTIVPYYANDLYNCFAFKD